MNQSTSNSASRLRARAFDGAVVDHPDHVKGLLRKRHWKAGRSAFETAHAWIDADHTPSGIPPKVADVLSLAPEWSGVTMTAGVFEHATILDTSRGPSMSDVMVLCQLKDGPGVLCVEGKAGETFDLTVSEWLEQRKPKSRKAKRLTWTCEKLGVSEQGCENLYWQLFHRTASAIIKARSLSARHSMMLVHDFTGGRIEKNGMTADDHFDDFRKFAEHLGFVGIAKNAVTSARELDGVSLRLGWVSDAPRPKT